MDRGALRITTPGVCLAQPPHLVSSSFHIQNIRLQLLAGQRVNNHIAKSTQLPSRVLTSFERCQLALGLTQAGLGWAGLGVGEETLDRGSGECTSAGCGVF